MAVTTRIVATLDDGTRDPSCFATELSDRTWEYRIYDPQDRRHIIGVVADQTAAAAKIDGAAQAKSTALTTSNDRWRDFHDAARGANEDSPTIAEWVKPTGAHDAYEAGAEVTWNGKTWVSLLDANVWEPGVSGWREKTAA